MKRLLTVAVAVLALGTSAMAQVQVDGAWARPTVTGQAAGGGYLALKSVRADRLVGASTPAAERVELHTMSMVGDVMQMRQIDAIDLPAGQRVELKPGGLHLMFMALKQPLVAGTRLPLTLRLEKAGEVQVEVAVAAKAPQGHAHAGAHGPKH